MTLDSRTVLVTTETKCPVDVSSIPEGETDTWIQPPISVSPVHGADVTILDGIYVSTSPRQSDPWQLIEPALAEELEAWDLASDEALALCEAQLD